jgi:hypothetical protein
VRPKILIAIGLMAAFLVGAMANGIYTSTTRAFNPGDESVLAADRTIQTAAASRTQFVQPANRTHLVQPKTVYVSQPVSTSARVVKTQKKQRSLGKEALIVGGSAGAGAAVGAVAGGKKGAAIGAVSGGVAGLVYDLMTRNK